MKIRTGFVSNSSSSSFVLMVDKETHEEILKDVQPYIKAVCDALFHADKVMGKDVMVATTFSDMGGNSTFDYLDIKYKGEIPKGKHEDEFSPYDAFDEYQGKLKEYDKDKHWSTDFEY